MLYEEGRYPYSRIIELIRYDGEDSLSDKVAAVRLGVSERQTRKARLEGMDAYLADRLACKAGVNPGFLFGFDAWAGSEEDLQELDRLADEADAKRARKAGQLQRTA